jgi:hypothetical protein
MRYFLDTEFNGFGGDLISLALVPEYGDREYYAVLPLPEELHPWVARNVVPYLSSVPPGLVVEPMSSPAIPTRWSSPTGRRTSPISARCW